MRRAAKVFLIFVALYVASYAAFRFANAER